MTLYAQLSAIRIAAAITIQRFFRGYLMRKKHGGVLFRMLAEKKLVVAAVIDHLVDELMAEVCSFLGHVILVVT